MKIIKLTILSLSIIVWAKVILAQNKLERNLDFGIFGGTSYYQGDINHSRLFYKPMPSFGAILRYAYHTRWAIRFSVFSGSIKGSDYNFNNNYQQFRGANFSTPIVEATGQIECNFLPYRIGDKKKNWTPYIFTGATFLIASYADHVYQPAIPFGIGIKKNFSTRFSLGIEWAYRKTFTDGLDNLSWFEKIPTFDTENTHLILKQRAYFHQKDYYAFLGIFFTYKLRFFEEVCNAWEY
ncbi:MAG: DUF6089 family protein [Bacteroidales bacterium]|nr:DUF6089 family protein [Bacteroidales bacterium]